MRGMKLAIRPDAVEIDTSENDRELFSESGDQPRRALLEFICAVRQNTAEIRLMEQEADFKLAERVKAAAAQGNS